MQPEQMRAARAALNWSLDDLASASGVHRNTLSNFETRKYDGEPEKLVAAKHTLESAGVIFIEEGGEAAGVRLRRFKIGDRVRFRAKTNVRFSFNIAADEVGTVVEVEPHPPRMGPTYMMMVKFPTRDQPLPYVFRFEYELVEAAPVQYKIWAGLARTQAEFAVLKSRWMARVRDSLHDALWDAMQIIDGGLEIVWEIEGDDGTSIGRQRIVEMVRHRRWELTAKPPQKY
jgi:transcriptional regulator with XRE-family HTH domain